ncbi:MAG: hypothetical protein ACI9G1_004177 [Pirellulaceae bacterium]|jgi:hypothetical protein
MRRSKRSRFRKLGLDHLESRRLLALTIDVGDHQLLPDTAQQFIEIRVESEPGDPEVSDFLMRAQMGNAANLTNVPVFDCTSVGCTTVVAAPWFSGGQIWDVAATTVSGGPFFAPPNNQHIAQATITFNGLGQTAVADGLLVRLEVDTTGITSGIYDLRLAGTVIGSDSHFLAPGPVAIPTGITNGSITVGTNAPSLKVTGVRINDIVDPLDLVKGVQPTSWTNQRSDIRRVEIDFDSTPVVTASDLRLRNLGVDAPVDADINVGILDTQIQIVGNTLVIDWVPEGPEDLESGVYELEILGTATNSSGDELDGNGDGTPGDSFLFTGNITNRFYQLASDWSGDFGVSVFDFTSFSYWFGIAVPRAPSYVDTNFDDGISVFDFSGFSDAFGSGVMFPTALVARSVQSNTLIQLEADVVDSEVEVLRIETDWTNLNRQDSRSELKLSRAAKGEVVDELLADLSDWLEI